ncbi:MAG: threonine--tRNA ligase [Myxococcales bacterium]|jgi:threonyl-tRNA synthetase|nr:threonine--tRNA ligase [Myxococcales bacterium]
MNAPHNRFAEGTVGAALAQSGKLKDNTVAAKVSGVLTDLHAQISQDESIEPIAVTDADALMVIRHSAAHVMADAVQRLFPGTQVTIGPAIDNGFYYDFDRPQGGFTETELADIEKEMEKVIAARKPFVRRTITRAEARQLFEQNNEQYKLELLEAIDPAAEVSLYSHGDWVDLCAGPHLPHTGLIPSFKLLSSAGAYWRGDERNKMLSRIYGTAFANKKELRKYLADLEEAKKRDHRKLGKELSLFSIDEQIGGGLVLWHPRGALVRTILEDHWRSAHQRHGYELIITPHIGRSHLWETSGHLENYAENMYAPMEIEGNPYYIKPMNCPFHIAIYKNALKSYRDLPIRWAELGTVYRFERSGQLHGLLRVRGFTQDDAHLFMRVSQLPQEIAKVLSFSLQMLRNFGFSDLEIMLATRPAEKSIGDAEIWEKAENALRYGLESQGVSYTLDEGGGAFYGPKIDIKIKDAIGRTWQCSTIQVDFNLPERFDLTYIGEDSSRHRPVMVHRALLGSIERFMGIMIEHYAGAFPVWLSPEQVVLVTVSDRHDAFAREVEERLRTAGIRVQLNANNEKLGAKIREARLLRVPVIAVIGDSEVEQRGVSLRTREEGDIGFQPLDAFLAWMKAAAQAPSI